MRIGVFAYNFPHYKSQQGLLNLVVSKNRPAIVFAQDMKTLKQDRSNVRIYPKFDYLWDTYRVANSFGISFMIGDHDSEEANERIHLMDLDLGIVLGARILKQHTIDCLI